MVRDVIYIILRRFLSVVSNDSLVHGIALEKYLYYVSFNGQ